MKKLLKAACLAAIIILPVSNLSAREFLNTFMQINVGYSYSLLVAGDLVDAENSQKSTHRKLKYNNNSFNFMVDVVPFKPIFFWDESHAFKVGFRGGYRRHIMTQNMTMDGKDYGGDLLTYNTFVGGPLIRYAPNVSFFSYSKEYGAGGGFTMYMLYGHIMGGNLNAFQTERAIDSSFSANYNTAVRGYKLDFGIGAEISLCSINLGFNVYYSQMRMKLSDKIYVETGRKPVMHEGSIEVYIGMPLENLLGIF
ncbi:MAG: hypothetical protein FWG92_05620 [Leptospirales bacterium]|nr:hypothetical protein [Leptospirales bacterium]